MSNISAEDIEASKPSTEEEQLLLKEISRLEGLVRSCYPRLMQTENSELKDQADHLVRWYESKPSHISEVSTVLSDLYRDTEKLLADISYLVRAIKELNANMKNPTRRVRLRSHWLDQRACDLELRGACLTLRKCQLEQVFGSIEKVLKDTLVAYNNGELK